MLSFSEHTRHSSEEGNTARGDPIHRSTRTGCPRHKGVPTTRGFTPLSPPPVQRRLKVKLVAVLVARVPVQAWPPLQPCCPWSPVTQAWPGQGCSWWPGPGPGVVGRVAGQLYYLTQERELMPQAPGHYTPYCGLLWATLGYCGLMQATQGYSRILETFF